MTISVKQGHLSKWLSPRKKVKKGAHRELREGWQIEMASTLVEVCYVIMLSFWYF